MRFGGDGVWRTGPTCRREPMFTNQSSRRLSLADMADAEESLLTRRRGYSEMSDWPSTISCGTPVLAEWIAGRSP